VRECCLHAHEYVGNDLHLRLNVRTAGGPQRRVNVVPSIYKENVQAAKCTGRRSQGFSHCIIVSGIRHEASAFASKTLDHRLQSCIVPASDRDVRALS
jgi:hypothetical protein